LDPLLTVVIMETKDLHHKVKKVFKVIHQKGLKEVLVHRHKVTKE
jgi:hypothetical protein